MHPETLRKRVRQAEADEGLRPDPPTSNKREEIKRLRKEVFELRCSNEILEAASVFFAIELDADRTEASAFIDEHRERFGIEPICRVLGVPICRVLGVPASANYQRVEHSVAR